MKDYKHLNVLHVPSNKIVSIFQFQNDATWIGKERDKLIAIPADTPQEIKEIEMLFTKEFYRYKETPKQQFILPFFKRKSGQPETLSEKREAGESEAHKLAKGEIFVKLFNGELKINGKTIKELGGKDLTISEEYHSDTGHAIADVFIHFGKYPNHHPTYGEGICIEVQFSRQSKTKTEDRTLMRLRTGWSVVWLFKNDFDKGKINKNNLIVPPREEQLKELRETEYSEFIKKMNLAGEIIDKKLNDSITEFGLRSNKIIIERKEQLKNKVDEFRDNIISQEESLAKDTNKKIEILDTRIKELNSFCEDTNEIIERKEKTICESVNKNISIIINSTKTIQKNMEDKLKLLIEDVNLLEKIQKNIDYDLLVKKIIPELFPILKQHIPELNVKELYSSAYEEVKKQMLLCLSKNFKEIKIFNQCPLCNQKLRFESTKIHDERIICGTCYNKLRLGDGKE